MSIRITHHIDDLAADMESIAVESVVEMSRAVRKGVNEGNRLAKTYARQRAGKHGVAYFKRLSAEMTGALQGEYGPEGTPKTEFVGVGFRHGTNNDLPNSADVIGPKVAREILDDVDGLFW